MKTLHTSRWCNCQRQAKEIAEIALIDAALMIRLYVWSKSMPLCWRKPFTTNHGLKCSILPSACHLIRNTHLEPTTFIVEVGGTSSYTPLQSSAQISSSMMATQSDYKRQSASFTFLGSSGSVDTIRDKAWGEDCVAILMGLDVA